MSAESHLHLVDSSNAPSELGLSTGHLASSRQPSFKTEDESAPTESMVFDQTLRLYSGPYRLMAARSQTLRVTGSDTNSHRTSIRSRIRAAASSTAFRNKGSPASFLRPVALAAMLFASVGANSDVVRCLPLW